MQVARLRHAAHRSVQTVIVVAVGLMAGWNAYICLRLRPDVPTLVINLAFWVVPILALVAATGLGRHFAGNDLCREAVDTAGRRLGEAGARRDECRYDAARR